MGYRLGICFYGRKVRHWVLWDIGLGLGVMVYWFGFGLMDIGLRLAFEGGISLGVGSWI